MTTSPDPRALVRAGLPRAAVALVYPTVTELAFVLLFTTAGLAAALLARRAAGDEPLVRRLSLAFCALAFGNLAFYLWRIVARDPGGAAQAAGLALGLALLVWGYRALLRRLRRMAARRRP